MDENRERLAAYLDDSNRMWLESAILACVANSRAFWETIKVTVCVHPGTRKKHEVCRDFGDVLNNAAYIVLSRYWELNPDQDGVVENAGRVLRSAPQLVNHLVAEGKWAESDDRQGVLQRVLKSVNPDGRQTCADYSEILREVVPYFIAEGRTKRFVGLIAGGYMSAADGLEQMHQIRESTQAIEVVKSSFKFGDGYGSPRYTGTDRLPMPLTSLTAAFGGGIAPGECGCLVAPQNGGKTVFTTQTAAFWSLNYQRKGLLITTEEDITKLEPRIISNVCNIPYGLIMDRVDLPSLTMEQQEAIHNLRSSLEETMRIYQWSGTSGKSVQRDLRSILKQHKEEMGGLDYFILDWLGPALGDMTGKENVLRHIMNAGGGACCTAAKDMGIVGWFNVQAGIMKSKNVKRIGPEHIAESPAVTERCALTIGVSAIADTSDPDESKPNIFDEQFINLCKTRSSQGRTVQVRREFKFQRFANR